MSKRGDLQAAGAGASGAEFETGIQENKRRGRLVLLFLLGALVIAALGLDIYYMVSRKPLTQLLPPVAAAAKALPPGYVTSFYGVNEPLGVAVTADAQRVYVAEGSGDRLVRAYDRSGQQLFSFSNPGSTPGTRMPMYLAVDGKGQVYVSDPAAGRITIFSNDGRFISDAKLPQDDPITAPLGVGFDRSGNLLVTDAAKDAHTVAVVDPDGKMIRRLGKPGESQAVLSFPNQATADSRGRVYVSNGNSGRVDVFGPDGAYIGPVADGSGKGSVGLPRGVAVDSLDRLYVVDSIGSTVQVFDMSGDKPAYLFSFATGGMDDGQVQHPVGIGVDATGRVYLADRGNSRLQVWGY